MVGSAVGIDDSSRAERKRQMHIEAKISQNLRSFEDGAAVQTSVGFLFSESEARTVSESRSLEVVETMIMICPGWRLQITRHALLNSAIVCLRGRHGRQCIEILLCALALSTSMVHTLANHRGESAEGGKPGILHTDDHRSTLLGGDDCSSFSPRSPHRWQPRFFAVVHYYDRNGVSKSLRSIILEYVFPSFLSRTFIDVCFECTLPMRVEWDLSERLGVVLECLKGVRDHPFDAK